VERRLLQHNGNGNVFVLCSAQCRNCRSHRALSENIKIKILRTIILPVVLCGCGTRSLTLRVFDIRVLKKIFGPKGTRLQGIGEDYITRSFVLSTAH
jgi:hypothetical protein